MMLKPRKMQYDKAGPKVAEALNKRYFEAYYCPDRDAAVQKVLELISADDTVSWGGTPYGGRAGDQGPSSGPGPETYRPGLRPIQ